MSYLYALFTGGGGGRVRKCKLGVIYILRKNTLYWMDTTFGPYNKCRGQKIFEEAQ